jgi:hypothetical protein
VRFNLAAAVDNLVKIWAASPSEEVCILIHCLPQRLVCDYTVLQHLRQTRSELTHGKRAQGVGIYQHQNRLVERADQILALGKVHTRFAAHARVHLPRR